MTEFANLVYAYRRTVFRIWLVSPWISAAPEADDPVLVILEAAKLRKCSVVVFTRPPDSHWHSSALKVLHASGLATIYVQQRLHTKLYIAECDGFRAAIVGSPNLTGSGDRRNFELGIELRTTKEDPDDDVAALVSDLTQYASALRNEQDVTPY
jgi:phosphatidylserine/phosphatidylglycerophosphate/cardiolipin synthase-like enzyme